MCSIIPFIFNLAVREIMPLMLGADMARNCKIAEGGYPTPDMLQLVVGSLPRTWEYFWNAPVPKKIGFG